MSVKVAERGRKSKRIIVRGGNAVPDGPEAQTQVRDTLVCLRFNEAELELVDELRRLTGLRNRAEVLRCGVRLIRERVSAGDDGVEMGRRLIG